MSDKNHLKCFKAYDIRGRLGSELDEDIAYKIAYAMIKRLKVRKVAIGYDARESSPKLFNAAVEGACAAGANVFGLGLAGTEEVYWAVTHFELDAGIEITASHNPIDYNGMKLVKSHSKPLTDVEFLDIKALAEEITLNTKAFNGAFVDKQGVARASYVNKICSFVVPKNLKPLKILINSGNGAAGPSVDALEKLFVSKGVNTNFKRMHHSPNSLFPHGIPNPMIEENRKATSEAVKAEKADFGVAFDGDFDRCFIFDDKGNFVPSEYVVGLLAENFLKKHPGATIIYDPRIIWNTLDIIENLGGIAKVAKTGHAFVKKSMRLEGAVYGGEMSAHHYFKEFAYCDSGMIPWLIIWELLSQNKKPLSDLISERKKRFPSSGEINFQVVNPENIIDSIKDKFSSKAISVDFIDGISFSFDSWRFNIRKSNTEHFVRLNVETRGDINLLNNKTKELTRLILSL